MKRDTVIIPGLIPMRADRATALAFMAFRLAKRRGIDVSTLVGPEAERLIADAKAELEAANS